ncbi:hypothetical protein ACTXT7_016757, partial [Hymenolepis weldensis]
MEIRTKRFKEYKGPVGNMYVNICRKVVLKLGSYDSECSEKDEIIAKNIRQTLKVGPK